MKGPAQRFKSRKRIENPVWLYYFPGTQKAIPDCLLFAEASRFTLPVALVRRWGDTTLTNVPGQVNWLTLEFLDRLAIE